MVGAGRRAPVPGLCVSGSRGSPTWRPPCLGGTRGSRSEGAQPWGLWAAGFVALLLGSQRGFGPRWPCVLEASLGPGAARSMLETLSFHHHHQLPARLPPHHLYHHHQTGHQRPVAFGGPKAGPRHLPLSSVGETGGTRPARAKGSCDPERGLMQSPEGNGPHPSPSTGSRSQGTGSPCPRSPDGGHEAISRGLQDAQEPCQQGSGSLLPKGSGQESRGRELLEDTGAEERSADALAGPYTCRLGRSWPPFTTRRRASLGDEEEWPWLLLSP